jgi:putative transposase
MYPQLKNLSKEQQETVEMLLQQIESQDNVQGLKDISDILLNTLMKSERDVFVNRNGSNKANGFYPRSLMTGLGKIDLHIPRDRMNEFRPFLLPEKWQRGDQSYDDLIKSLVIHAYSPNKIRSVLKNLGLSYSAGEVEELKNDLYERSVTFKTQQLPEKALCLYIDAYHTRIKDPDSKKVVDAVIHTVIGLNEEGLKEVYGYYEYFGTETKEHWLMVLNNLIHRGLIKPLLIISDDFPGLKEAINALFDKTDHQLCFIHMQRNVRKNMSKEDSKEFNDTLKTLRTFKDFDKAVNSFENLCQQYQKKYPHFIQCLLDKKERYFIFLKYPKGLRKHIYTTNVAENFNSRLELMRVNLGGYFQSSKTLQVAMQVLIDKLQFGKWRKPAPMLKACEYEINQLFNQRFSS